MKIKYQKKYGEQYQCMVPKAQELYQLFTRKCEHYGILHRMKDIIDAYQKVEKENQQFTLF